MKRAIVWIILIAFLLTGLVALIKAAPADPIPRTPAAPKVTDAERQTELATRRAAVAAKMAENSTMVLFGAEPRIYSNSVDYYYRQENNLYYLTALKQVGAALVISKKDGKVAETLFLPKRNALREAWEGKMYSREQATKLSGLTQIVEAEEFPVFLEALKNSRTFSSKEGKVSISAAPVLYLLLPNGDNDSNGKREFRNEQAFSKELVEYRVENARPFFADLRHIKSPYELKLLQHAVDITTEAQLRAMAMVGRAKWEYEVHAEVEYTFRRRNADYWGYPSIVGCGENATTLHYVESQGPVRHGELLLMDVGAEYDHFTADVTRTFPVNGKFSKEQAEIYQIVYDAQEAVAKATKPGATMAELSQIARSTINEGLFKLGLVTDKNSRQVGYWFIHGLGHWLGMNVHDVGNYNAAMKPGMVFTNEPGIYIRADALDNLPDTPENKTFKEKVRPVFEKYKNIGVRIEDVMLVTDNGVEWMTAKLPRRMSEIEAWMAKASKEFNWTSQDLGQPTTMFVGAPIDVFAHSELPSGLTVRSGFRPTDGHGHSE
ncbi:MAG TPA: aminopeptidase P family protein [Pyrinomonadaceae bacterium]|nr:aminopeptidase P family protein [Pyrinomonadaceae bacterium]